MRPEFYYLLDVHYFSFKVFIAFFNFFFSFCLCFICRIEQEISVKHSRSSDWSRILWVLRRIKSSHVKFLAQMSVPRNLLTCLLKWSIYFTFTCQTSAFSISFPFSILTLLMSHSKYSWNPSISISIISIADIGNIWNVTYIVGFENI